MKKTRFTSILHLLLLTLLVSVGVLPSASYAQEDMTTIHKETLRAVYESAFNAGDLAMLDTTYAEDYVNHGLGEDLTRDDFKAYLSAMQTAMPDFQVNVEVLIAEADWAASRVVYTGTFENEWMLNGVALAPTGETLEWTANILHRFNEEGLIAEDFTGMDRLALPLPSDTLFPAYLTAHMSGERRAIVMGEPQTEGMEDAFKEAFTNVIEDALSKGDLSVIDNTLSDDYITEEPFGDFSRQQFHDVMAGFRAAVPDLNVSIEYMVVEGDWLAARLLYAGNFTNPITSDGATVVEPTNEPIRLYVTVFVHINADGVPIEDFKEYNRVVWLQQFGVLPTPQP